jgi:hypothetical protein
MDPGPTTTDARPTFCASCNARLSPGAKFCHRCATRTSDAPAPSRRAPSRSALLWAIASLVLVAALSLIAGRYFARQSAQAAAATPNTPLAPDISAMSPEERADRLWKRVMDYVGAGKHDSAQAFAPMAISAFEAVAPQTLHTRYDLGLLRLVTGDGRAAAAQADTILRNEPTHLLGLMLAASAADARADSATRNRYLNELAAASERERARALPEYVIHAEEIESAVARARQAR